MIELTVPYTRHQTLLSRRGWLRASVGAGGGLGTAALWRGTVGAGQARATNKAVIQIWLGGGPSHIDLYDMKPDAPAEYRGPFRPVATAEPGMDVCELLPLHAPIMRHLAVVRSLHHDSDDHVAGTHWMQTGYFGPTSARPEPTHPSIGSCIARALGEDSPVAVPYIHVRPNLAIETYSRQFNATTLGPAFEPLHVITPFPGYGSDVRFELPALQPVAGLDAPRLGRRMSLREQFDGLHHAAARNDGHPALDGFYRQALDLVTSPHVRNAFDLSQESPQTRERYGQTGWGQAALLCRRLVEAGVSFITLNTDISSNLWDNHAEIDRYFQIMLPAYDRMLSGLITDLVERGLYEQVIVVVWGVRPHTRDRARGGRDHWGAAGCALLGGGGIRGGTVFGSTTSHGEEPRDEARRPADVLATLYHLLRSIRRGGSPILPAAPSRFWRTVRRSVNC
ncbi:MAG: DUF1501 domain-containing protein [Planctomycetaceae bacterium]